ncbi:MAG: ABC transporter permease [Bdellovibrionota bacterium]
MMQITKNFKYAVESLGAYGCMLKEVLKDISSKGINYKEVSKQMVKIGIESIPIVVITAAFSGMVLALQTAYGLQRFGAKNYVGNIIGLALVRELGPALSALVLCGRVGAGTAAEIGSMVVTEQVDAIKALGANPIRKLVTPKIVAAVISIPLLVVLADFIGIYGGGLVAIYELDLTAHSYFQSIVNTTYIRDVIDGLIKSGIFGFLFVSIACFKGLNTRGGTEGVGLTTTATVVVSSIVVLISDYFLTKALILFSS